MKALFKRFAYMSGGGLQKINKLPEDWWVFSPNEFDLFCDKLWREATRRQHESNLKRDELLKSLLRGASAE